MKKSISFITLLLLFTTLFSISSFAADARFSLKSDDNIKPGKAFNIYLSVSCSTEIGIFRTAIYFDSDKLEFKSAELYNKSGDEYFKYNIDGNKIILVYMSDTNTDSSVLTDIIKLRFSPKSTECADYKFECDVYEIGDKDAALIESYEPSVFFLSVSDNGSTSQETVKNQGSSSVSDNVSEYSYKDSYKESDNLESNTENEESNTDNNNEYSLSNHSENITMQQDNFSAFVGIAILFVIVAVVFYSIGSKKRKI